MISFDLCSSFTKLDTIIPILQIQELKYIENNRNSVWKTAWNSGKRTDFGIRQIQNPTFTPECIDELWIYCLGSLSLIFIICKMGQFYWPHWIAARAKGNKVCGRFHLSQLSFFWKIWVVTLGDSKPSASWVFGWALFSAIYDIGTHFPGPGCWSHREPLTREEQSDLCPR